MCIKNVSFRVYQHDHVRMGQRLNKIKAGMKLAPHSGKLDWKTVSSYRLRFNDKGACTRVKHHSGAEVEAPSHAGIDNTWEFYMNYSDTDALVVKAPCPPIKLCLFFRQADSGPCTTLYYKGGACKEFTKRVMSEYEAWEQERANTEKGQRARRRDSGRVGGNSKGHEAGVYGQGPRSCEACAQREESSSLDQVAVSEDASAAFDQVAA
jgi:hypothetical protein